MPMIISENSADITRQLNRLSSRLQNVATAKALNSLAFGMTGQITAEAATDIDGPTPFTLRGFRYQKAKRAAGGGMYADVYVADKVAEYLKFVVDGGTRVPSRKAVAVPTGSAKLNRYGNMPRKYIKGLLENKKRYFSGKPRGRSGPAGIWERTNRNHKIRPVVLWEPSVDYPGGQLKFREIGLRFFERRAGEIFRHEIAAAISSG